MDNKQIIEVLIEDIIPNRFQPRLAFNEKELLDLADSIRMHGIIQPLILRKIGDKFEIIAGERRYKASTIAGLTKVPAVVMNTDDDTSAELALVENIQRKDLTAIEEAQSYKKLTERGMTQEQIAKRLGLNQSTVANRIRLLSLPKEVHDALLRNQISERHARCLLSLKESNSQIETLNKIISQKLTVKDTENLINRMHNNVTDDEDSKESHVSEIKASVFLKEDDEKNTIEPETKEKQELEFPEIVPMPKFSEKREESPYQDFKPISTEPVIIEDNFKLENPLENDKIKSEKNNEFDGSKNIMDAVRNARGISDNLKGRGFDVDLEEFDFEDMYQIVIKIKKD